MAPYRWPHPRERFAQTYRRAHEAWDRTPVDRLGRAGFGHRHGFHGRYMDRPGYRRRLGDEYPPEPAGSGWPYPIRELPPEAAARHRRAAADRELAREVDFELYQALGYEADRIGVWADNGVITLDGALPHPRAADRALATAASAPTRTAMAPVKNGSVERRSRPRLSHSSLSASRRLAAIWRPCSSISLS